MNRRTQAFCLSAALVAMISAARAEVDLTFTNPGKYADAGLRREGGVRAREVTLRTLREHMFALGQRYLAPNQSLRIEILDVDLAGEIEWWHGPYDIRYRRDYTWPKIKLRYTLEEGGQTIRSGEETVSDPSYRMNIIATRSGDVMPYEKAMLARWFRSRFAAGKRTG